MVLDDYQGVEELICMEEAINYNSWISFLCKPYIKGTLLEIGSGIGSFTKEWLGVANDVVALEMAQSCVSTLNERFQSDGRITVLEKDIMNLDEELICRFDSAVSINVLEHVENDEVALSNIYKSLKPGGILVVFVPAFQILYGKTDRAIGHYRRYSKRDLRGKLARADFQVIKMRYVNFLGFFAWFLTKNKEAVLSKRNILLYDRYVVPLLCRTENFLQPPIGQSILAISCKAS